MSHSAAYFRQSRENPIGPQDLGKDQCVSNIMYPILDHIAYHLEQSIGETEK